jgi:subtilisin family serine protease
MARGFSRRLLAAATAVGVTGSLLGVPAPAYADAARDSQWHLPFLKIADAHKISQGEGIIVAVIDSGVDSSHQDLIDNILPGTDVVPGGNGNGLGDKHGHGTAMAGLIVAHGHGTDQTDGILGIAPKAKALPIRYGIGNDVAAGGPTFAAAVDYAIANKAKIISVSGSVHRVDESLQAVQRAQAAGLLVIAAAGNKPADGGFIAAPASYRGVIAVGAVDRDGTVATVTRDGPEMSLAAPGVEIRSTGLAGQYSNSTGTSDAAAIVSGVAALVWAQNPSLTAREVTALLTTTAIDKGPAGRDEQYGYGIVNPVGALTKQANGSSPSAASTLATAAASQNGGTPDTEPGISGLALAGIIGLVVLVLLAVAAAVVFLALRRRRSAMPNSESRQ